MGRYLSIPILLIAAILQSTVVPQFRLGGGGPDLIMMAVLSWILLSNAEEGAFWAVVGGIVQDLISGLPTGTTALALVLITFVINLIFGQIARNNFIIPPIAAALGTALYHVLLIVLLSALGRNIAIVYVLINVTFPTLLFNLALITPVYRLLGWVYGASRPRRVSL